MTEKKRKRGQNFSMEDKQKLIKLLILHKDTILNKKTDGPSNEAKSEAWILVTDSFNSSSYTHRSKESLMKVWEKMKSDSKTYHARMRSNTTESERPSSKIETDPVFEQVCSLLGRGCSGVAGCGTETGPEGDTASCQCQVYIVQDDLSPPGKSEPTIVEENDSNSEVEESDSKSEEVQVNKLQKLQHKKTPLWSRRWPRMSSYNERSEATPISSSITNVYKRKFEDLRRNLLQDEIDFKRKLYDLQLQSAAKDLEIKTAILEQIKDGCRTENYINNYYE